MAVTFNQVVDRARQQLLGYTKDQAAVSYLTTAIDADDLTMLVDPSTVKNLSRGLLEIDDELVLAKSFDATTGTVTLLGTASLPSVGRGVEGTTAASHVEGSMVTNDPRFPKQRIKEAINDTIIALYPDIWVFGEYEFPYVAARYEYPLPVEVDDVYKVVVNTIGPSRVWFPSQKWRFNPMASTGSQVAPTPAPTGKSLQIYDFIVPGRNVRVSYTKPASPLVNLSDDFTLTTGLPERMIDMIVYGACWRVLPSYEAGRLQQQNIEATERAALVPTGAAKDASQFFLALYSKRLEEERDRLIKQFESYQTFNG